MPVPGTAQSTSARSRWSIGPRAPTCRDAITPGCGTTVTRVLAVKVSGRSAQAGRAVLSLGESSSDAKRRAAGVVKSTTGPIDSALAISKITGTPLGAMAESSAMGSDDAAAVAANQVMTN